jgi:hypothetical protein
MMTSKPKRKAPPANFFTRLWRALLFTREFYFETEASPEACADAIRSNLTYEPSGCLDGRKQDVSVDYVATDRYQFKIEVKQREWGRWWYSYSTNACASGNIFFDESSGQTLVEGEARVGLGSYLGWLSIGVFISFMIFKDLGISIVAPIALTAVIFFIPMLLALIPRRNRIVHELDKTLRSIQSQTYEKAKVAQPTADYAQEEISGRRKP